MITKNINAPLPPYGEAVPPILKDLLAEVTDENIHPEIDTNGPVGNEMEL